MARRETLAMVADLERFMDAETAQLAGDLRWQADTQAVGGALGRASSDVLNADTTTAQGLRPTP